MIPRSLVACILFLACSWQSDPFLNKEISSHPVSDSIQIEFPWINSYQVKNTLINRVTVPSGFTRKTYSKTEFPFWLSHLPLFENKPDVLLYDGSKKRNQDAHAAVFNIDVGNKDLQQCADAVIRLRAEFLRYSGKEDEITFRFTSGDPCPWKRWMNGERIQVKGNKVSWKTGSSKDGSYQQFRSYLNTVFTYAGTRSLSKEMKSIHLSEIAPGDVFIQGGSPGHAVMVMDRVSDKDGKILVLLAQSYMPAQQIHLLRNPNDSGLSPWFVIDPQMQELITPEWKFKSGDLKSFN